MGVEHLANSISLAIADSASGSSPPDYGNFLNQLPRYLPPIIGGVGAFIPLLLFSAFSDCFKKSSALIFSTLGIQIWFAYFVTVKAGAALGYTELLTFVFLPVALLFLLSLLWYSTKFPPTTRHFLKVVYTLYSGALLCLTIATTNFFGFGSLQIYILRVLPKDAKSVEETYQTEVRTANQLDTKEEREKAIKDADAHKQKLLVPEVIEDVTIKRKNGSTFKVIPKTGRENNEYSILLPQKNPDDLEEFGVNFKTRKESRQLKPEEFREDITRWAFGNVYEIDFEP
jgi:hypothetical protein